MKNFTLIQWIIILILALLTALEPLSIDLYLPGFIEIANAFDTSVASVQISLSAFLAGFAVGQLVWGPIADRFGRKKPILFSLIIFTVASLVCLRVKTIEQLWVLRFIQAVGGCAGVVISRAIVTDYFDKSKTLKIFSLLALIMGVAPILAPSIGNGILQLLSWQGLFGTLAGLGAFLFFAVLFFLPETRQHSGQRKSINVFKGYWEILKVKKFTIYSLIAGIVNGALMIYVANGPFLIMEKGGFSTGGFSLVFTINAAGLMISSFLTSVLQKYVSAGRLVKYALLFMCSVGLLLLISMYWNAGMFVILFLLFWYIFPIGILFPATTELAITPFVDNSGMASSLFGSIQLGVAFVCTIVAGVIRDGNIASLGLVFFLCSMAAFITVFAKISDKIPVPERQ